MKFKYSDLNIPCLLVLPGVGGAGLPCLGGGDDAGLSQEGVGEGGLAVVHVGDHGHVADVVLAVHDPADLVDREVHLEWRGRRRRKVVKNRTGEKSYVKNLK